tara:strand:- start:349 stop:552 length:204 start_codon:yes stop_codon:yes gene_type:complete
MDNIVDIKNALDVIKPILNAAEINQLNKMIENAITAYHEGLVDSKIANDLDVLNITASKFIFDDSPF